MLKVLNFIQYIFIYTERNSLFYKSLVSSNIGFIIINYTLNL